MLSLSKHELGFFHKLYIPSVGIWEDDDRLTLRADMPGMTPDKVSVKLDEDSLVIEGQVDLAEYQGKSPVYTEYNAGSASRSPAVTTARVYRHVTLTVCSR